MIRRVCAAATLALVPVVFEAAPPVAAASGTACGSLAALTIPGTHDSGAS